MKSFHQHLILFAVALLFSGMAGGLLDGSRTQEGNSVPVDNTKLESPDAMQEGVNFRLVISEEAGRTMVPTWRHVQW